MEKSRQGKHDTIYMGGSKPEKNSVLENWSTKCLNFFMKKHPPALLFTKMYNKDKLISRTGKSQGVL